MPPHQCHLTGDAGEGAAEHTVYLRYLHDLLVDVSWEPGRLARPAHTVTHETVPREDVLAVRLNALLQARTHAGVKVDFDADTATYTVSWFGGPEVETMREYVAETEEHDGDVRGGEIVSEPRYRLGRVEYDRKPMPDLEELAAEAVNTQDPNGWWSPSRRRRETAEVLRKLHDLADHGYTAVEGFMISARQPRRR